MIKKYKTPWIFKKKAYIEILLSSDDEVYLSYLFRKTPLAFKTIFQALHDLHEKAILKRVNCKNKKIVKYELTEKGKQIKEKLMEIKRLCEYE